jgi:hypothetical protein
MASEFRARAHANLGLSRLKRDFYRKALKTTLIPLKNLQDSRICHVLM